MWPIRAFPEKKSTHSPDVVRRKRNGDRIHHSKIILRQHFRRHTAAGSQLLSARRVRLPVISGLTLRPLRGLVSCHLGSSPASGPDSSITLSLFRGQGGDIERYPDALTGGQRSQWPYARPVQWPGASLVSLLAAVDCSSPSEGTTRFHPARHRSTPPPGKDRAQELLAAPSSDTETRGFEADHQEQKCQRLPQALRRRNCEPFCKARLRGRRQS